MFIKEGQSLSDALRESGKFSNHTSDAEKQKKIDSVNIDFNHDNILPELNKEDLGELGKESKPVLLKKSVIEKNKAHHPEVDLGDYNMIVGQSLYSSDKIVSGHTDKPYFNFLSRVEHDKSSVVLLEMSETKTNYEIINLHWLKDRQRRQKEKKKD